jgi:Cu-processing system permease protein
VKSFVVARDLLREAASRRWFLALGLGITLMLVVLGLSLRMDVVDGALAATRFFGKSVNTQIRAADVALRPVFIASSYLIFYGGLLFYTVACADFGPSLLAPGRIEHLLSLPVRRFELVVGTFLGVLALALIGALYGAGGLVLIFGVKTGVYSWRLIVSALLASVTFTAIYGAMLTVAIATRSAALSAASGGALVILGIVAGERERIAEFFDPGISRSIFRGFTLFLPRVSSLARSAGEIAGSEPFDPAALTSMLFGLVVFGLATLSLGIHLFERKDF